MTKALVDQTKANKIIDLFILTHGGTDSISVRRNKFRQNCGIKTKHNGGNPLNLRAVYMIDCVGSSLNDAWLKIGAKSVRQEPSKTTICRNPPCTCFWNNWKGGQSFKSAVENSYKKTTIGIMDGIIKSLPIIGEYLAKKIDVKNLVVKDNPVIKGDGSLTIKSPR
ncbi:MAG: hypothetical protein R3F37_00410 [Candidatus Competibacteraceae bacterium]